MKEIQLDARFQIPAENRARFKELAPQLIEAVQAREPGALRYEWFFNADESQCVVREIYADSRAVAAHGVNVGNLLAQLLKLGEVSIELYGPVSDEVRAAFGKDGVSYFDYFGGVRREGADQTF